MAHPVGTRFKGPIRSDNGFISGSASFSLAAVLSGTVSVDPASLATLSSSETAVTITGAAVGDIIIVNVPASLETGLAFSGARISATNTAQIRLTNVTAGSVDGAARNWTYIILRPTAV